MGIDVGPAGRLTRLLLGLFILGVAAWLLIRPVLDPMGATRLAQLYAATAGILVLVLLLYTVAHLLLGSWRRVRTNPWKLTILLVGPLFVIWTMTFSGVGIGRLLGAAWLDLPIVVAILLYAGSSLLLTWRSRYGGCEVVEIPSLLIGRRLRTYCIPVVVVDYVEKSIVDKRSGQRSGPDP